MRTPLTRSLVGPLALLGLIACGPREEGAATATGAGPTTTPTPTEIAPLTEARRQAFADSFKLEGYTMKGASAMTRDGVRFELVGPAKENGASISIHVMLGTCDPFVCRPQDLAAAEANKANLAMNLPPIAKKDPGLTQELVGFEAGGHKGVGVYTLYMVVEKDAQGGTTKSSSNGLETTWHDGRQLVQLRVRSVDWGAESSTQLAERMSKDELVAATKAALEAAVTALAALPK